MCIKREREGETQVSEMSTKINYHCKKGKLPSRKVKAKDEATSMMAGHTEN